MLYKNICGVFCAQTCAHTHTLWGQQKSCKSVILTPI